ncbi:hypothetical protein RB195_026343 [Necator americanus]|uniref:Reverse transcriptase domain-containing protein n=1 Tax=Necator americanus TaxID=51031 RepID=A0ABR1EWH7_NECAM
MDMSFQRFSRPKYDMLSYRRPSTQLKRKEFAIEALDNQGVPTQYIKVLRELYSNFTNGISPFYKNIIIDVKRGVRQVDTISPKTFTATLKNAMRKLEWDDRGVKVDGRQLHHLRFADDIVLISSSISQAERMLTKFDETCGCFSLLLKLEKLCSCEKEWMGCPTYAQRNEDIRISNAAATFIWVMDMKNDLTLSCVGGNERVGELVRASRT